MTFEQALERVRAKNLTVCNCFEKHDGRWQANVTYRWKNYYEFACADTPGAALSAAADKAEDWSGYDGMVRKADMEDLLG